MADDMTLTHLDDQGRARMVDVGGKSVTVRSATASATVHTTPAVINAIRTQAVAKGDVLAVARIAGIQAAKRTAELIPLCHNLSLDAVEMDLRLENDAVYLNATARCSGRTGVEMEALTAVSVAALAIYDMCKALDKTMVIGDIRLDAKSGGRSGDWRREDGIGATLPEVTAKPQRRWRCAVITLSDRASRGVYEDRSGPVAVRLVQERLGAEVIASTILPDDRGLLTAELCRLADVEQVDLVITSGGTGLSPRDVTPEATKEVIDREVPGLAELLRQDGARITPRAALSRAICGLRGRTLIVNLSGSPKAVAEQLETLLPLLPHALAVAAGTPQDCGR